MKKQYFPSLDGLRFLAFLLIFIHHLTFYVKTDISRNPFLYYFRYNGWIGVDIFFILTGFLITLHLLEERKAKGKFNLSKFWKKRVLRIWPLYYLGLIAGYFIAPFIFQFVFKIHYLNPGFKQQIESNLPWYLVFLGNFKIILSGYGDLRSISELWAISLDQQFYIFWPLVLVFIKSFKKGLIFSLGFIFFAVWVRVYLSMVGVAHPGIYVNTFSRLDSFIWGSILAFVLFYKPHFLDKLRGLYSPISQLALVLILAGFLYWAMLYGQFSIRNGIWGYLVVDGIFSLIILSLIYSTSIPARFLASRLLRYLGTISYGLYVWHILALEIISLGLLPFFKEDFLLFVLGLPLTILFGAISYHYFEKRFLKIRSKS